MQVGVFYTLLVFLIWGLFPLYFKALHAVSAEEIVLHRLIWALIFLAGLLIYKRRWAWLKPALKQPKLIALFTVSAILLAGNWYTYVWAINAGHVVDASLGYFINSLIAAFAMDCSNFGYHFWSIWPTSKNRPIRCIGRSIARNLGFIPASIRYAVVLIIHRPKYGG